MFENELNAKVNEKSYNKIVEQWDKARKQGILSELVVSFASKLIPNGSVLDIGCGTGYPIAKYLCEQNFMVTGIDVSGKMLQKAFELNLKNAEFHLCDFYDFVPEIKFDGVIAFDSFFHFPKERQSEIYEKVASWMKDGAYLLFTHGNEDNEKNSVMFQEPFYYSSLKTSDVHNLLYLAGFEIELSIERYKENDIGRDLVIIAKKVK